MNKPPQKVTKKDVIFGVFAGIIIIAAITLFIMLAFESKLSDTTVDVLHWLLPVFLFLGGILLILTYVIDKNVKKKSFLIGGIVICVAAIVFIVLKATNVLVM